MRVVQPLFTGGLSHLAFLSDPILRMTCMADRAQETIDERSCPCSERRGLKERTRKHWTNYNLVHFNTAPTQSTLSLQSLPWVPVETVQPRTFPPPTAQLTSPW